jgi:prepilin-type N-terminal cleavage/methylation domain-containing protein
MLAVTGMEGGNPVSLRRRTDRTDLRKRNGRKGFTLVELAIVCVVLGILVSLAVPNYSRSKAHSARTSCICNQRNLFMAASLYVSDLGIRDAVINGKDLYDERRISEGISDCPQDPELGQDDYLITIEEGRVTSIACAIDPVEHCWSP